MIVRMSNIGMTSRSVRTIDIDDEHRLVLIRRTKPNQATCRVAPGGGVESSNSDLLSALRREFVEKRLEALGIDWRNTCLRTTKKAAGISLRPSLSSS